LTYAAVARTTPNAGKPYPSGEQELDAPQSATITEERRGRVTALPHPRSKTMNFIQIDHQMLNLDHVFRLRWKGGLTEDDGQKLIVDLNTVIGEIPYISTNALTRQVEEAAAL